METNTCRCTPGLCPGPFYCIIYTADICRRLGIEIPQFSDETAAFTTNKNINYVFSNLQIYDFQSWL
jgi:hypothetical protein